MANDAQGFDDWLDATAVHGKAATRKPPQTSTRRGTYKVTPFQNRCAKSQAIPNYWTNVAQTQQGHQFGYQILAVTPDARNRPGGPLVIVSARPPKQNYTASSLSQLDENSRCHSIRSGGTRNKADRAERVKNKMMFADLVLLRNTGMRAICLRRVFVPLQTSHLNLSSLPPTLNLPSFSP